MSAWPSPPSASPSLLFLHHVSLHRCHCSGGLPNYLCTSCSQLGSFTTAAALPCLRTAFAFAPHLSLPRNPPPMCAVCAHPRHRKRTNASRHGSPMPQSASHRPPRISIAGSSRDGICRTTYIYGRTRASDGDISRKSCEAAANHPAIRVFYDPGWCLGKRAFASGEGVEFVDSAREKNKARAVAERSPALI